MNHQSRIYSPKPNADGPNDGEASENQIKKLDVLLTSPKQNILVSEIIDLQQKTNPVTVNQTHRISGQPQNI